MHSTQEHQYEFSTIRNGRHRGTVYIVHTKKNSMHGSRPYSVKSPSWERTENATITTDRDEDGENIQFLSTVFSFFFLIWDNFPSVLNFLIYSLPQLKIVPQFSTFTSWTPYYSTTITITRPLRGEKRGALELSDSGDNRGNLSDLQTQEDVDSWAEQVRLFCPSISNFDSIQSFFFFFSFFIFEQRWEQTLASNSFAHLYQNLSHTGRNRTRTRMIKIEKI